MSEPTRECGGVVVVTPKGKRVLACGHCHRYFPERSNALARYRDDGVFLDPPNQDQGWNKRGGIYTLVRSRGSSHHPAPGSRVKCPTCQWINTVPEQQP